MEFRLEFASIVPKTAKQEVEAYGLYGWDWVEAVVWTERMLAALGNGVKGGKWYSLIDKVYNRRTLKAAWKKVASNRGAAGIDKVSIKRFRSNAQFYLEELERDLRNGVYRPSPVRRVHIPKDGKKTRPLGIPTMSSYCTSYFYGFGMPKSFVNFRGVFDPLRQLFFHSGIQSHPVGGCRV